MENSRSKTRKEMYLLHIFSQSGSAHNASAVLLLYQNTSVPLMFSSACGSSINDHSGAGVSNLAPSFCTNARFTTSCEGPPPARTTTSKKVASRKSRKFRKMSHPIYKKVHHHPQRKFCSYLRTVHPAIDFLKNRRNFSRHVHRSHH